jgi:cysteine desulfuration protein SufE
MTIASIQQEIIEEFEILAGDRESTIFYIMELGQKLPSLDAKHQTEENLIKGCQSKVWLVSDFRDGKVYFHADSNTEITKGLISLLIRILSERTPEEIMQADLFFLQKIGMSGIIGSQRSNGLASMIKQMKLYALAFQQLTQK